MKKAPLVLITFLIISVCSIDVAAPGARNFFLFNVDGNPVILDSLLSTGPVVICMYAEVGSNLNRLTENVEI